MIATYILIFIIDKVLDHNLDSLSTSHSSTKCRVLDIFLSNHPLATITEVTIRSCLLRQM